MEFQCASIHGVDFSGAKAHSDTKQKGYCTQGTYGYMPVERTSGHIIVDIQGERQSGMVMAMACSCLSMSSEFNRQRSSVASVVVSYSGLQYGF
ncbi:hypothetical protein IFM89_001587 [Coptis chinensis]|uniref:Uncharacterized protein n=1 Tax=Coptis chinensis TaxID=261450 RepID=A0A835HH77_9MAGN|nr:hypothetical protein IFM89_001587 [Coptis chinensis]